MGRFTHALVALFAFACMTCEAVRISSCSKNAANDLVKLNWANINPSPVKIPGNLSVAASFTVNRPFQGNLNADITISRQAGLVWFDIPCIQTSWGNLGSCTYKDVCSLLAGLTSSCPSILTRNNIPCKCPIQARTYTIPKTVLPLNLNGLGVNIPAVISGGYRASIRVTDASTMTEVACFDVDVELSDSTSSSLFGNIGRFLVNLFG